MCGPNRELAMRVVLEIIRQSSGDEIESKTKLFKAFYFAHLYYAAEAADYLTDWPIVKMPRGPGIDRFNLLLESLLEAGAVTVEKTTVGPYPSTIYRATGRVVDAPALDEQAIASIRKAVEFVTDKTGAQLSDITHEHSRSWDNCQDGEEMNIYADLLPEEEYEDRSVRQEKLRQDILDVWTEQ